MSKSSSGGLENDIKNSIGSQFASRYSAFAQKYAFKDSFAGEISGSSKDFDNITEPSNTSHIGFLSIGSIGNDSLKYYESTPEPFFVTIQPSTSSYPSTISNESVSVDLKSLNSFCVKNSELRPKSNEIHEAISVLSKIDECNSKATEIERKEIEDVATTCPQSVPDVEDINEHSPDSNCEDDTNERETQSSGDENITAEENIFLAILESISDTKKKLKSIDTHKGLDVNKLVGELNNIVDLLKSNTNMKLGSEASFERNPSQKGARSILLENQNRKDHLSSDSPSKQNTNVTESEAQNSEQKFLFRAMFNFSQQINELVERVITDNLSKKSSESKGQDCSGSIETFHQISVNQNESINLMNEKTCNKELGDDLFGEGFFEDSFAGNISLASKNTTHAESWNYSKNQKGFEEKNRKTENNCTGDEPNPGVEIYNACHSTTNTFGSFHRKSSVNLITSVKSKQDALNENTVTQLIDQLSSKEILFSDKMKKGRTRVCSLSKKLKSIKSLKKTS
mmetsp:Transcript_34497/g.67877  ORF Transcript_34497/g.67877 Transcript_34497/m.67877 type:complete len:512 (+) Transcript_34497:150-1685(+)